MGSLEIFFLMFIVIGVFVGFVVFELRNRKEHAPSTGGDNVPSHLHRGINSSSIAGEGLSGLPGLLITVAFVFMFFGIFLPRQNQWFLVLFVAVEIAAAGLYVALTRRSRRGAEEIRRALHRINEKPNGKA